MFAKFSHQSGSSRSHWSDINLGFTEVASRSSRHARGCSIIFHTNVPTSLEPKIVAAVEMEYDGLAVHFTDTCTLGYSHDGIA